MRPLSFSAKSRMVMTEKPAVPELSFTSCTPSARTAVSPNRRAKNDRRAEERATWRARSFPLRPRRESIVARRRSPTADGGVVAACSAVTGARRAAVTPFATAFAASAVFAEPSVRRAASRERPAAAAENTRARPERRPRGTNFDMVELPPWQPDGRWPSASVSRLCVPPGTSDGGVPLYKEPPRGAEGSATNSNQHIYEGDERKARRQRT